MGQQQLITVDWAGTVAYDVAWERQKALVEAVRRDSAESTLLLLEHPPTYTFGRRGKLDNLLYDAADLAREGITVHWVDRGGDVTYHGPGQLVGYPIVDLRRLQKRDTPDVHRYLRDLEQTLIDALAGFGVAARRFPGYTGVWVDGAHDGEPAKIAAIGVKVSGDGITSHGFALNIDPNLAHFAGIIPCGITDHGVTSLAQVTGRPVSVTDVVPHVAAAFAAVFAVETTLVSTYNAA